MVEIIEGFTGKKEEEELERRSFIFLLNNFLSKRNRKVELAKLGGGGIGGYQPPKIQYWLLQRDYKFGFWPSWKKIGLITEIKMFRDDGATVCINGDKHKLRPLAIAIENEFCHIRVKVVINHRPIFCGAVNE